MNILETNVNGGYPIELDDFRFLDNIYRNGIHQVIRSLADNAILTGVERGVDINNNEKISEGWVILDGEIGYLPETIGLSDSQEYGIVSDNFDDPNVIKVTQAGQTIKPHKIRRFKIEPYHPSMGDHRKLWQLKSVKSVLKDEFGLSGNTLTRSWITETPSSFDWNGTTNRYEATITHNQTAGVLGIQGVSILLHELTSGRLMSLPSSFSWELTDTNIIIIDNSPQGSNDDFRGAILNGGLKIIFESV
ncbi:MAG: hypothetical protein N4A35_05475 [Flavobacteriales bacterium]|jgi:hypothetical protein|nr:hypothetical protein [Flavobacteriales bacterium]